MVSKNILMCFENWLTRRGFKGKRTQISVQYFNAKRALGNGLHRSNEQADEAKIRAFLKAVSKQWQRVFRKFEGGVMDIHELKQFEFVYQPSKEIAFCWLRKQYVQLSTEENHAEVVDHANDSLRIWQAAKAQAVPEGFVVVPVELSESIAEKLALEKVKLM